MKIKRKIAILQLFFCVIVLTNIILFISCVALSFSTHIDDLLLLVLLKYSCSIIILCILLIFIKKHIKKLGIT
jgi:hypothetical protein